MEEGKNHESEEGGLVPDAVEIGTEKNSRAKSPCSFADL